MFFFIGPPVPPRSLLVTTSGNSTGKAPAKILAKSEYSLMGVVPIPIFVLVSFLFFWVGDKFAQALGCSKNYTDMW